MWLESSEGYLQISEKSKILAILFCRVEIVYAHCICNAVMQYVCLAFDSNGKQSNGKQNLVFNKLAPSALM